MSTPKRFKSFKPNEITRVWAVVEIGPNSSLNNRLCFVNDGRAEHLGDPAAIKAYDNLFLEYPMGRVPKFFYSYAEARAFAKRWNNCAAVKKCAQTDHIIAKPVLLTLSFA